MRDLGPLLLFTRVAELGSFTRAAEDLGMQKGRASIIVRELETRLGASLLHRTTRSVQMTEDGRVFYARACSLLAEADELDGLFNQGTTSLHGKLRIDLPTVLAQNLIIPALPSLLEANPGLALELSSTDRRVDLVQEGFDCVVRLGPVVDEGLIAKPLGAMSMINAASPRYLARYGVPESPDDLLRYGHRMVHYTRTFGSRPAGWEYPDASAYSTLELPGAVEVNNVQAYHAAGLAGLGLIQAGSWAVAPHLQAGTLVEVLAGFRPEPLPAFLVVAHRRHLSGRVRGFMQWLEGVLRPHFSDTNKPSEV